MWRNKKSAGRSSGRLARFGAASLRLLFLLCGLVTLLLVLSFFLLFVAGGIRGILHTGPLAFFFGTTWLPAAEGGSYGILPLFLSTVTLSTGALLLAVLPAVLCALYVTQRETRPLARATNMLASLYNSVPSVLFGLLGVVFLLPWLRRTGMAHGESLLAALLVLAAMVCPRLVTLFCSSLRAVPARLQRAALALGATPEEIWYHLTLRHAWRDMLANLLMYVGILSGETLAVVMVAGNVAGMPLLGQGTITLATAVAGEAFNATGDTQHALLGICLVLLLLVMFQFGGIRLLLRKAPKEDGI